MKPKLIIVEGIPGSGKTTTAKTIRDWVEHKGLKPKLYLEDSAYHPVDLDNLSYFEAAQYQDLVEAYRDYQHALEKISEKSVEGYFVHYRCLDEVVNEKIPDGFLKVLFAHDAHDTLPAEKYRALLLERWQRFCAQAKTGEELVIFECCFLQNPITIFIGKHNYAPNEVKLIIRELAETAQELDPLLINLRADSVRETIERAIGERPEAWINLVEKYITGQGYGKAHHLSGREGIFQFYELMQAMEGDIMSELGWRKLCVDNSDWDWERHTKAIEKFLAGNV